MKLHNNQILFRQAIQATAQQMDIPAIYVEKDYWVTVALHAIFHSPIGADTVFKGGTSLLKCYGRIKRFSEDIDLIVLRNDGESDNKMKTKLKNIGHVIASILPEVEIEKVTRKMGMSRKTAHTYTKEFQGNYGQVRDVIIVEATWLGYFEPYTVLTISSFIYEMMIRTGQQQLAEEYGLQPFKAKVLDPRRTFCEKIMSLVRFSYTEDPINDLKKKIRHVYDLYQLMQDPKIASFFNSDEFDKMLLRVGQDDVVSFRNNNAWLQYHPSDALIFSNIETVWREIASVYNSEFRLLVFGDSFPSDQQILEILHTLKKHISKIKWDISITTIKN